MAFSSLCALRLVHFLKFNASCPDEGGVGGADDASGDDDGGCEAKCDAERERCEDDFGNMERLHFYNTFLL